MLRTKAGTISSRGRAAVPGAEQIPFMAEHAALRRKDFYVYYQKKTKLGLPS